MNFTEKKSAKFLESKRAKVQVLKVREDSKHCGIKCGWNEFDFKATTKASLEVQIVISVITKFHSNMHWNFTRSQNISE